MAGGEKIVMADGKALEQSFTPPKSKNQVNELDGVILERRIDKEEMVKAMAIMRASSKGIKSSIDVQGIRNTHFCFFSSHIHCRYNYQRAT